MMSLFSYITRNPYRSPGYLYPKVIVLSQSVEPFPLET
jgi:hypothetical protein